MKWLIRTCAALLVSGWVAHGTAQACVGDLSCSKAASLTEITEYPATVTYTVTFAYSQTNDRCAVARLSDSLLPPDFFSFPTDIKDPNLFWVSNPATGTEFVEYQVTIDSFDACVKLGGPVQADGSVKLVNYVNGASYFGQEFDCQKEIVCRPPPNGHGCTLTPGYWMTHSEFGPAPYDDTWANLPDGASTPFFGSGQNYLEVMWAPSAGGNAYYILAQAYVAAVLNGFAGASAPDEVSAAIDFAAAFFAANTPSTVLTKPQRGQALAYATVLDNYNNGYIGPGHCKE